jgi:hypothetical protein
MSLPRSVLSCIFALALVASISAAAQSVTTWHNDNNRTGWQQNETILTPASLQGFGLIWQWTVAGQTYAQPLAVANVPNLGNIVIIATEQDMLYAFSATSLSQQPLWSTNLATQVGNNYSYVNCAYLVPPCMTKSPIYPYIGITGTPVISTSANAIANVLYVVTGVQNVDNTQYVQYYLHAIDITTGAEKAGSPALISASATGAAPPMACHTSSNSGTITFDPHYHIQRTGLLLLTLNGVDYVYFGFAPVFMSEVENGWVLGYSYGKNSQGNFVLTQVPPFVTTPFGTGGGIWESGAGLASDGSNIYVPSANGTFDANSATAPNTDYGDSMLKLAVDSANGSLSISDFFTPPDVLTYNGQQGVGYCINDLDFGSGGVLLIPDAIPQNDPPDLLVSADKESNLNVVDRNNMGGFQMGGPVEITQQPPPPLPQGSQPGYWSSPAYWKSYTTQSGYQYNLYYAVDEQTFANTPWPMSLYSLSPSASGPINQSGATASTPNTFCGNPHAPTPSISSNGTAANSGLVWAIESSNHNNPTPGNCQGAVEAAVLHAYNPATLAQLYTSSGLNTTVGHAVNFPVPTISNGKVYMGTLSEVDVFGPCTASPTGHCLN